MARVTESTGKFVRALSIGDVSVTNKKVIGYDNARSRHLIYEMECLACGFTHYTSRKTFNNGCRKCGNGNKRFRVTPEKRLWNKYKWDAERRGYEFSLPLIEFSAIISKDCFYCGKKPCQKLDLKWEKNFVYNGIDRKDNFVGYIISNCVPCCGFCNRAKNNCDFEEWVSIVKRWASKVEEW